METSNAIKITGPNTYYGGKYYNDSCPYEMGWFIKFMIITIFPGMIIANVMLTSNSFLTQSFSHIPRTADNIKSKYI